MIQSAQRINTMFTILGKVKQHGSIEYSELKEKIPIQSPYGKEEQEFFSMIQELNAFGLLEVTVTDDKKSFKTISW